MLKYALVLLGAPIAAWAAPALGAAAPTVTISSPQATIVGASSNSLDSFNGVPFAQQPTGSLRLRPAASLTSALGTVTATGIAKSCPQFFLNTNLNNLPASLVGRLLDLPLFQEITNAGEDCLTLDIVRPAGTTASSKLPVVVWIFGGGFELGSTSTYNAASLVSNAVSDGKPYVSVAINYRVGGFGFLPGSEILADGAANLGLLDQRRALEWVADNIAAFGGDPTKVTIWGESAGAISVFDQMALYDGDNTYNGQPLFRGAIMDSGSIVPADPVDCPKGDEVFNTVVTNGGCAGASDKLECLRGLDYTTFLNAANSVPGLLSYSSVALSYLPRPDGTALTQSPEVLVQNGKYAKVPFIIGDQEDEGTIFSIFQSNLTTNQNLVDYFSTVFFRDATTDQIEGLLATYPEDLSAGSPFRTGILNALYPQYKRLAAIIGDISFTLTRRAFLSSASAVNPDVPSWSYLASYDYGTPFIGTCHASDILQVFIGIVPDYASASIRSYYYSFFYHQDPNVDSGYTNWPWWSSGQQLLQFSAGSSNLLADDFRNSSYAFIAANVGSFHI
jgi:carboxylesterase type B